MVVDVVFDVAIAIGVIFIVPAAGMAAFLAVIVFSRGFCRLGYYCSGG